MTWAVTCRNGIVTDHALITLGHHDLAEELDRTGQLAPAFTNRAVFSEEGDAVDFANKMAVTFPEEEVAIWRQVGIAGAQACPGRQRGPGREYFKRVGQ